MKDVVYNIAENNIWHLIVRVEAYIVVGSRRLN